MQVKIAVAYYRVSTVKQGRSGLGLEAQQSAIHSYCTTNGYSVVQEIQEIKSTRKIRPRLEEALTKCRKINATLIVARLDRLGRDVEQIARIVNSKVDILVTDNPHANRFTIHILAAVAEEQRRTISENTKAALLAAKKRGKVLGSYGKIQAKENRRRANVFAKKLKPIICGILCQGFISNRAIASELNKRKIPTFQFHRGSRWHETTVRNLFRRLKLRK